MADTSVNAFDKIVDALLASPQFGERWARHWLDLVRYAESRGHEFEPPIPNPQHYRDYVIRAFNADVPYDQFLKEHIAGDLLPAPRLNPQEGFNESIVATGFWFMGEMVHSPVDIRGDETNRFDNMIDVTCKSFMGLTVACARCHDHKFDAINTKDYYSLMGFLESSSYRLARFDSMEQNKKIAHDLWKLRADSRAAISKEVVASMRPTLDRVGDYLLAAREVIQSPAIVEAAAPGVLSDVVFEDFEKGTYEGWDVTGTAFGKGPQTLETIAPYQGKINGVGRYFVNSHNIRGGADMALGDALKGTMTSRAFTVNHSYITMLVGGGSHAGKTCVNLLIDNRIALTATGRDNNIMFPVAWDARPFKGKSAKIQIVDNDSGGWGNIGVDQIVFTNTLPPDAIASNSPGKVTVTERVIGEGERKRIASIATSRKLDPGVLTAWVMQLSRAEKDATDPLHVWAKICADPRGADAAHIKEVLRPLVEAVRKGSGEAPLAKGSEIIVDYARLGAEDWLPDDVSFGALPMQPGDIILGTDSAHPIAKICDYSAAEFDPAFAGLKAAPGNSYDFGALEYNRAGKTIRTRKFAITSGTIHFLVHGHGHIYANVDSHAIIAGPLHGALVQRFEAKEGFEWHSINLATYKDQRAHLEFTAESPDFAVALVIQGERPAGPIAKNLSSLAPMIAGANASLETLAASYQRLFTGIAGRIETGRLAAYGDNTDPSNAPLANWMIQHPALFAGIESVTAKTFAAAHTALTQQIKNESRLTMALMDGSGEDENVMKRGAWKTPGEVAPRQLLEAIGGKDQQRIKSGSGRLELANRMADPTNPFTARVMVNRLWHHLFGRGIVSTTDNFGKLGTLPTHPELLDYLAADFVKQGWSNKKLIREMMLTSTYQMNSAKVGGHAGEIDPDDLLLHRMRVRRLEGEAIRDNILAVSGRLDLKMFGMSIPTYLTDFMQGRGRPASGPVDGAGRRSVYLSIRRNFLSPMMLAFDMPIPFNSMGTRSISNVPAQALILMNDPLVIQQAQAWAKHVLDEKGLTPEQRITRMYQTAFSRTPADSEIKAARGFLERQGKELGLDAAKQADDPRVWSDLAHVLFNFKEFIFIN